MTVETGTAAWRMTVETSTVLPAWQMRVEIFLHTNTSANEMRFFLHTYSRGGLIGNPRGVLLSGLKLWFAENNFVSHIRNWLSFPEHILFFSGTLPRPRNSIFSDMQVLGSLSFFWKYQFFGFVFDPFAKMIVQNIFFRFGKKSNFLSFFYVLGRQEPVSLFSWSKTNSNWAPLEKWWRTKIFIVWETPIFFAWETILQNQSLHSQ